MRCTTCGTQFLDPQPTDERLAEIYGDAYYEPWSVESADVVDRIKRKTAQPALDACRIEPGSVLLDVGCGTGSVLADAAERGAHPYGIDVNPRAIDAARERAPAAGLHVGRLSDHPFAGIKFDAVVMIDFLEHVRDPEQELATVRARMRSGSRLVLSTPRVDGPLRRVLRRHWPQYREEHLTYFSRRGITDLLQRCGFVVSGVAPTRKVLTLAYAYGQAVAYPIPVVTPVTKLAYRLLPAVRHRPLRVGLGEMTVVATLSER
jgi:SAM-dependent methyltransferase